MKVLIHMAGKMVNKPTIIDMATTNIEITRLEIQIMVNTSNQKVMAQNSTVIMRMQRFQKQELISAQAKCQFMTTKLSQIKTQIKSLPSTEMETRNGLIILAKTIGHGLRAQRHGATLLVELTLNTAVTAIMLGLILILDRKSITTRQMTSGSTQIQTPISGTTIQNGHGETTIKNGISGTTSTICGSCPNMELYKQILELWQY